MRLKVQSLHIYPLKSAQGIEVEEFSFTLKGPKWDRHWMVVDGKGQFMSQRLHPKMALIETSLQKDHLLLSAPNMTSIKLPFEPSGDLKKVTIWLHEVEAVEVSQKASAWMKEYLGNHCSVVVMKEDYKRHVDPKYSLRKENIVDFADGFPLLIALQESLVDLNHRLETPISMNRFRPNIVLEGGKCYEEDNWKSLIIGSTKIHCVKPCSRCSITCTDQSTGIRGSEPLKTLASYRKIEKDIIFGQNAIHEGFGTISLNDSVEVVQ